MKRRYICIKILLLLFIPILLSYGEAAETDLFKQQINLKQHQVNQLEKIGDHHSADAIRLSIKQLEKSIADQEKFHKQVNVMTQMSSNPDQPYWMEQRDNIIEEFGNQDRNEEFGRVFDSLTVALASRGIRVTNMERRSGFISVERISALLPPDQLRQLQHDGWLEWCKYSKVDPSLLGGKGSRGMDIETGIASQLAGNASMTTSLVNLGSKKTRVKVRFSGVYYPPMLKEFYRAIWPALDLEILNDKSHDLDEVNKK